MTEFEATILSANSFDSSSVAKSMTVLLMYGVMWGVGLLVVCVSYLNKSRSKQLAHFHENKVKAVSRSRSSPDDIQRVLSKYIDEIFPTVFQTQSYISRMMEEIMKHHRYVVLFTTRGADLSLRRIITCVHLLTVQSMLMFMLAVLYDLQVRESSAQHSPHSATLHLCCSFPLMTAPVMVSRHANHVCRRKHHLMTLRANVHGS